MRQRQFTPVTSGAPYPRLRRLLSPAACQRLIDEVSKPRILPVIRPTEFNYPVGICGKWHGTRYGLIQRYRSAFPKNLGEEFDVSGLDQPQALRPSRASAFRRMRLAFIRLMLRKLCNRP
jgi:hypothetical protein